MRPIPYPASTRAKGWRFELDMERVRQSDTWALAGAPLRPWLMMLWAVSWEQTPCGSLPNDPELIAARLEMPLEDFLANRAKLLRGWWEAEDGRLYLDTIVERVNEMLDKRATDAERAARSRARRAGSHESHADVTRDSPRSSTPEPEPEPISPSLRSGEGGARKRGTRLPDDWEPSDADRAFCLQNRPDLDLQATALQFRNHWTAKPGADAVKLDWARTWQNWVLREKPGPAAKKQGAPPTESFFERDLRLRRARFYENAGLPVPDSDRSTVMDVVSAAQRIAG